MESELEVKGIMRRISAQIVGAFGEKSVEAELLRRGWTATNVNASIKNAANFDIFAVKEERLALLRVKTSGPEMKAFQFSFRADEAITPHGLADADFTVLVDMGSTRSEDDFYILPTRAVREVISAYKQEYLGRLRRDGGQRKDTGHWTLHLAALGSGEERLNYNLATKWSNYRGNWALLDTIGRPPGNSTAGVADLIAPVSSQK